MRNAMKVSPRCVILVEPDDAARSGIQSELAKGKYEVVPAKDLNHITRLLGDKFSKVPPLVVLVDMVLPKSSGFDLARRIQEKHGDKKLDIYILAKHLDGTDHADAHSSGAVGLLQKPVTLSSFEDALEALRMRKLKEEIISLVLDMDN